MRSDEDSLQKVSQNIFITGFPKHFSKRELWNVCSKYGVVSDVFIASKLTKLGKAFGFVRFIQVDEVDRLIANLCTIWIGSFKVHANMARFSRLQGHARENIKSTNAAPTPHGNKSFSIPVSQQQQNSYASVLRNGVHIESSSAVKHAHEDPSEPAMVLDESCLNSKVFDFAWAGSVKEFQSLPNLSSICIREGFSDVVLKYLGGLWVLFQFKNQEAANSFYNHLGIRSWLSELVPWKDGVMITDRIVWLDVEGIPLFAWSDKTFEKIASRWGELMYVDDSNESNCYSIRLCVKTSLSTIIMESFKVIWKGMQATVRVKEVMGW